jgi:very-short-patch-repair endonuclease
MEEHVTRADLIALGITDRQIRRWVELGELLRARRGHFVRPDLDQESARAIAIGGRLTCLSELRRIGVWVLDTPIIHVHVDPHATRLRGTGERVRLHWNLVRHSSPDSARVGIVDALLDAGRCLHYRAWIASVDSALHGGQLHPARLHELRRALPANRRHLIRWIDRRAESGLESIVRVLAVELGLRVRSQVTIPGVGRVDLVIEDWIVVETDGSAFHDQALSPRDRRRDARLIATGRSVLRPGYSLVVHDLAAVARQLIGAVAVHRRVKNSGYLATRARQRAFRLDLSGVVDGPGVGRRQISGRAARAPRSGSG